eukprot:4118267-Pyramimonas_sp.AAC.1
MHPSAGAGGDGASPAFQLRSGLQLMGPPVGREDMITGLLLDDVARPERLAHLFRGGEASTSGREGGAPRPPGTTYF